MRLRHLTRFFYDATRDDDLSSFALSIVLGAVLLAGLLVMLLFLGDILESLI